MLYPFVGKVNLNSKIEFKSHWFGTSFSQETKDKFLTMIMNSGGLIFGYLMRLHSQKSQRIWMACMASQVDAIVIDLCEDFL